MMTPVKARHRQEPPRAVYELVAAMFWHAHEKTARRHYREERAMSEWFDYGGEA